MARARSLRPVKTLEISDERRRERHSRAQPHHRPGHNELRRAGGEATGQAGGPEHSQPRQQHALAAEPVRQAAESQQQRGEHQVERVNNPLQLSGGMQLAHHRRKRHIHQGRIQVDQERRQQQRDEDHRLGSHGSAFFTVISSVSRRVRVRLRGLSGTALRGTLRIPASVGRHPEGVCRWNIAARRALTRRCDRLPGRPLVWMVARRLPGCGRAHHRKIPPACHLLMTHKPRVRS